ncbi:MAG: GtrA family protein [Ginsengibacter sp.]
MNLDFLINPWIAKAIKFGMVGTLGLVIDFAVTYFCKEKLKWNKFLANSIGFSLAVVQNYFLNRVWTFSNTDQHLAVQFSKFLFVAIGGLVINNILLYFFLKYSKGKYFYVCKGAVVFIVFIWNFLANAFYTFH